jgi:hypothetical protein
MSPFLIKISPPNPPSHPILFLRELRAFVVKPPRDRPAGGIVGVASGWPGPLDRIRNTRVIRGRTGASQQPLRRFRPLPGRISYRPNLLISVAFGPGERGDIAHSTSEVSARKRDLSRSIA